MQITNISSESQQNRSVLGDGLEVWEKPGKTQNVCRSGHAVCNVTKH